MSDDFNKPPHTQNSGETQQKKRIPVLLLVIVGIFLAAFIFYMVVDRNPKPGEIPADESIPAVQADDGAKNTVTEAAADTATASDH